MTRLENIDTIHGMKKIVPLIFIFFALECACKAQSLVTFEEAVQNSKKSLQTSKVIYARKLKTSPATTPNGWAKFFVVTESFRGKPYEGISYESSIFVVKDNVLFHDGFIDSADYGMDEQEQFAGGQAKHLYIENKSRGLGRPEETVNLFYNSALQNQIENIRIQPFVCFIYDFNKDGYDDIITLDYANITMYDGAPTENQIRYLFYSFWENIYFGDDWEHEWTSAEQAPEFVIFNGRRGIKVYGSILRNGEREMGWLFFYFDKNKNCFLRDESASSSELESVHGSENFFADYGLDFNALDRELNLQQIQNVCTASLRVLRNAIYARHGRTFKSEDLQSLFNEYPWYEPSPAYSDSLLTATDKHNIALIKQVEENPKKTSLYLEQTMFDSKIPQTGFSSNRREMYMAKYDLRCHEIAMAETATKGMAAYLFMTSEPLFDLSVIDESFHDSEIEFEQRYGQCKPDKSYDSISYFEALLILCGNEMENVRNLKINIQTKHHLTGKELLDLQKSIRKMKAEEERKKQRFTFPLLQS